MPVPVSRYKILPLRGLKVNLDASLAGVEEGEICYATDQDQYYQKEGGVLVAVGATKVQGLLADSAVQPGDNVSTLTNDAGFITAADVPDAPVVSVAGKTGDVTLVKDDITDLNEADYATAVQGALADSAVQPADNISVLVNDAGFITAADVPSVSVTSVAGKTGDVTLVKADITDLNEADYATAAQGALADSAVQPADNISTLNNDAGYITAAEVPPTGVTQLVAGDNVIIDPAAGTGVVTVSATLPVGGGVLDGGDFDTGIDTADGTAQLDGGLFT